MGSEDGRLYKCSKTSNSQFLATYEGHAGAMYAVHWNSCHPDTFLSASADWTVKLWHNNRSQVRPVAPHARDSLLGKARVLGLSALLYGTMQAVITLDLGCPVGDAAWAPYSATVLAAAGEDGRVQVGAQDMCLYTHYMATLNKVCSNIEDGFSQREDRTSPQDLASTNLPSIISYKISVEVSG